MNTEIEAAGALIDGGLVAHEIEGAKLGAAHGAGHHGQCLNCGAPLGGRYCANCGQGAHVHRSLLHLVEELLHGLFHFDAKGWRTLPLLVARPGLLTRRYVDGQRMRYVSPLALFLFMVFLMFFVASLSPSPPDMTFSSGDIASAKLEAERDLDRAREVLAKQQANVDRIRAQGGDASDAQEELASAQADVEEAQIAANAVAQAASAAALRIGVSVSPAASAASATSSALGHDGAGHAVPAWARVLRDKPMNTGHARFDAAVKRAADNPELTVYKLKNTAYKFSFMLVPISLPFLWLLFFRRRGITMYDHAVFVLYSLSFMSLLFVALVALAALHAGGGVVALLATFAPPLHMAAQLKETYRLGWWSTLWRTAALLIVAAVVFMVFLLLIVYVTMG